MAKTIRGTTPSITFNLPFDTSTVKNCEVYFGQNDSLLFTKGIDDCVLSGTTLTVTLSQADTLMFDEDEKKMQMQIRFVFNNDTVDATDILKGSIGRILKDGEIDVN